MAHVEQGFPSTHGELPEKSSVEIAAGGGIAEAVAATGAVVLSIIGLASGMSYVLMSIACILAGAALLFEGGAIAGRYSKMLARVTEGGTETAEVGGGIAAEALAGAAGVVLGILALIGIHPVALVAVANIVFGAGLLIGSGATSKAGSAPTFYERGDVEHVTREAVFISAGGEALVGVGAVVLGILSLLHAAPVLLNFIALLGVGGALMLGGTALGAKMLSVMRRV